MSAQTLLYSAIMLFSGLLIPVMAALNGRAGLQLGNPIAASVALLAVGFAVALAVLLVLAVVQGEGFTLKLGGVENPWVFGAGAVVAFYILSITALAPRLGVGTAVFLVLLGQIVAASVIDHFGLFGAPRVPLDGTRVLGLVLMLAGVLLARKPF